MMQKLLLVVLLVQISRTGADVFVTYPESNKGGGEYQIESLEAAFGDDLPEEGLPGKLIKSIPLLGCSPLKVSVKESDPECIVLIKRGNCSFAEKVKHAQDANFSGVIVFNDVQRPTLIRMNANSDGDRIYIPSVFVDEDDGKLLLQAPNHTIVTLTPTLLPELLPKCFTTLAAAAACGVLVFALFIVYRRQQTERENPRQRRMPRDFATHLPHRIVTAEEMSDETCCICLDNYSDGDEITELPCKHFFHKACVIPWLTERDCVCPICKRDPMNPDSATERTPLIRQQQQASASSSLEEGGPAEQVLSASAGQTSIQGDSALGEEADNVHLLVASNNGSDVLEGSVSQC